MPYTLVYIDVKPECVDDFVAITKYNCENSQKEEGNVSFELLSVKDEPTKFVLCEHFIDGKANDFHKTTEHYKKWKETVDPMMASPRTKTVCEKLG